MKPMVGVSQGRWQLSRGAARVWGEECAEGEQQHPPPQGGSYVASVEGWGPAVEKLPIKDPVSSGASGKLLAMKHLLYAGIF